MPIEIRELVIRATVDPHSTGNRGSGSCGVGGPGASGSVAASGGAGGGASAGAGGASDDVIQSCVREVMRILEQKRER